MPTFKGPILANLHRNQRRLFFVFCQFSLDVRVCRVYFSFSPWNTNGTAQGRRPGTNSTEEGRGDEKKKKTTDTSGIKKNRSRGIGRGGQKRWMTCLSVPHTHTHTLDDDEPKRESAVDDESVRTKKKKPTGQTTTTKSKRMRVSIIRETTIWRTPVAACVRRVERPQRD